MVAWSTYIRNLGTAAAPTIQGIKNLGFALLGELGDAATKDVGTGPGSVAAGDDPRIVNALQPVDGRLNKINIPKFGGVFDVLDYVRQVDAPSAEAIEAFTLTGQDGDKVLAAVRAAGDDAMTYARGRALAFPRIEYPTGLVGFKDEMFSDDFQNKFWMQTNLLKQKGFLVSGKGVFNTTLQVRSDYVSSVRNSLNGNQRTYGPWADGPSPSFLIPALATVTAGAPANISVRGMRLRGTGLQGVDPVALGVMNELDARQFDLHIQGFGNYGDLLQGSFNSLRAFMHCESNGAQPVEGGPILGNPPGFPPPWVAFDVTESGGVVTLTAKARAAFGGYAIGDLVPFFYLSQIGKDFAVHAISNQGSTAQVCRVVIASVSGNGVSSATVTLPAGVTLFGGPLLMRAGSFLPVKASVSANGTSVVLSDYVKVGRGARDMIGQMVSIPKAGSKGKPDRDVYTGRVVAVSDGDDALGYKAVTLAEQVRASVSGEAFIWSAAHAHTIDETVYSLMTPFDLNDTDFIQCRWENSGGYGEDQTTGAYQWIVSGAEESVQYVSCKIHGANTVQGQFGAEGQCIIDNADGLQLTDVDFTHFGLGNTGQVRIMGARGNVRFVSSSFGGWQLNFDWCALYLDPKSGYDQRYWSVQVDAMDVKNLSFPTNSQQLYRNGPSLLKSQLPRLMLPRKDRDAPHFLLDSSDDLNDIRWTGIYRIASSVPANMPAATNNCMLFVHTDGGGARVYQTIINPVNGSTQTRGYNSGTWGPWVRSGVMPAATTAQFADATSDVNTKGKTTGQLYRNTSTGGICYPSGVNPTDNWNVINRDSTVTPV